jgi:hypothetical protein
MIPVEGKSSIWDSKRRKLEYGSNEQGPKELRIKPNMQERQDEGFEVKNVGLKARSGASRWSKQLDFASMYK